MRSNGTVRHNNKEIPNIKITDRVATELSATGEGKET